MTLIFILKNALFCMVVVEQATDLKTVASAVQSLHLKKWTCWLANGLVDDSVTRLVSNNFLHMLLFFLYKHRHKSKEIKKIKKMSTKNEQMDDLSPSVGKDNTLSPTHRSTLRNLQPVNKIK